MTCCRVLLFGLLGTVVGIAVTVWFFWPRTAITRENVAKVQNGMTLAEVEALLGGPERIETTGPTEGDADADDGPDAERLAAEKYFIALTRSEQSRRARIGSSQHFWGSDRVAVFVVFDADQRVVDFAIRPLRRASESPLDMLRRWLRL